MGTLTNTAPVWSGGKLKMIPYGDVTLTANGATYTPNTTPIYDLTDDDYLGGGDPIKVSRKPQADAYNHIRIEFVNRANLYNVEIAEAKDSANIDANGLRSASIFSAHWICDASIARTVAQIMLQRAVYVRNTYTFTLAWTKALLEPMDLVTLTDSGLGFNKLPVRIIEIAESENGDLSVVAEEYPQGVASATLYATQSGGGFQHDYNAAPGSIAAPMIFEAPGALAQNGLEIYVAATGTGAAWGGCNVWVSLDGTNYKNIGTLNGGSRYGTLSAACGASGTVSVALNSGVLASGSVADAAALNTLCYIGGAAKEFFAFNTATLTSALHYDLGGTNNRGAYVTPAAAHASGDKFARVDSAIARSGPVDLVYVGKTIHVKCTSFNIYGANEESLASVTDYTYTVTGAQIQNNAGAAALTGITSAASDNILSASEKPPIIQDYTVITGEQSGLDAQATSYSITTEKTAYDAAITALTAYLATLTAPTLWSNVAGDTTIVGTTFRSNFAAVYTAKQTLVNKITAVAGTISTWSGTTSKPANVAALAGTEAINNAAISLASNGTLSGGSGGAVTIGGLGYVGALNATADLSLYNAVGSGQTIAGNSVSGSSGGWTNQTSSRNAQTAAAYCAWVPAVGAYYIAGLDPSPTVSAVSMAYAIIARADGTVNSRDSGGGFETSLTTYVAGDVLAIEYDGVNVRYLKNGTVYRTISAAANQVLYFGTSVFGGSISNIRVGPLTNIAGVSAAAAAAALTANWATVTGAPTSLAALNSADGSKLSGIAAGATVGATWGSNLSGQPADNQILNNFNTGGIMSIPAPVGGKYAVAASGQVGALKIRLPQGWTNTMLRFQVQIFEYSTGMSCTYEVGGFTYAATSTWYNTYAKMVGGTAAAKTVRFGSDGSGYCCVWIGEPASTW
ncbi:MAG: phage tail protein, partial [Betaproteobacteria bacterium]